MKAHGLLALMGALENGKKKLLALGDGYVKHSNPGVDRPCQLKSHHGAIYVDGE
jgi:hypothetical protein